MPPPPCDAGKYHRIIAKESKQYLKVKGKILTEIGYNQKDTVTNIFQKEYKQIECTKDLENNNRMIKCHS